MTILAIDKGVRLRLSTLKGPLSGRTPFVYGDPPTTSDEACTDARELPRAALILHSRTTARAPRFNGTCKRAMVAVW